MVVIILNSDTSRKLLSFAQDFRTDYEHLFQPTRNYVIYKTSGQMEIDGKADEHSWNQAIWTDEFIDIEGPLKPKPYCNSGTPQISWDASGFKSAVSLHGTLNNPNDIDQKWIVEMAIPFEITKMQHCNLSTDQKQKNLIADRSNEVLIYIVLKLNQLVRFGVGKNQPWTESFGFFKIHLSVGDNDDHIANSHFSRCRSI